MLPGSGVDTQGKSPGTVSIIPGNVGNNGGGSSLCNTTRNELNMYSDLYICWDVVIKFPVVNAT